MKLRMFSLVIPALLLAACAGLGDRETDEQTLARYLDFAGAPVDSFHYLGRLNGWRALGSDKVVVYTGANQAYLLSVAGPCRDLQFTQRIGLTSSGSTVKRRFDSVLAGNQRCQITDIRPVDYGEMRRAAREGAKHTG